MVVGIETLNPFVEQLVDIYQRYEWWHNPRMSYVQAYVYHKKRLENGAIHIYEENGEVLGYYERYFKSNTCILHNLFIKPGFRQGRVFHFLYRHFFDSMPQNIDKIQGEKQKLNGRMVTALIKRSRYGKH